MPMLGENSKVEIRANFYNIFNQVKFVPIGSQAIGTLQLLSNGSLSVIPNQTFGQAQMLLRVASLNFQARSSF